MRPPNGSLLPLRSLVVHASYKSLYNQDVNAYIGFQFPPKNNAYGGLQTVIQCLAKLYYTLFHQGTGSSTTCYMGSRSRVDFMISNIYVANYYYPRIMKHKLLLPQDFETHCPDDTLRLTCLCVICNPCNKITFIYDDDVLWYLCLFNRFTMIYSMNI